MGEHPAYCGIGDGIRIRREPGYLLGYLEGGEQREYRRGASGRSELAADKDTNTVTGDVSCYRAIVVVTDGGDVPVILLD